MLNGITTSAKKMVSFPKLVYAAFFLTMVWSSSWPATVNACYPSIISFGGSISDTGNRKQLAISASDTGFPCMFPPYGHDFVGDSNGRCSDGRLIIDFLAESLGLPLIPPINGKLGVSASSTQGVNYAVSSSTALDISFVEARLSNGSVEMIKTSLGAQMTWFKRSVPSICGNPASSGTRPICPSGSKLLRKRDT